jgi:eight-cysteine-cluster-containing protein
MRTRTPLTILVAGLLAACSCPEARKPEPPAGEKPAEEPGDPAGEPPAPPAPPPPAGERVPMVPTDHPLYDRVEGVDFPNDCESDDDCFVGGCSGEVCSAEEGVQTTCEARDWPTEGGSCGCVQGTCVWYEVRSTNPGQTSGPSPLVAEIEALAARACSCADVECAEKVQAEFVAWVEDNADARAQDPDRAAIEAAKGRLGGCLAAHEAALPGQGQTCAEGGRCHDGLTCVEYYGVAGKRGPKFSSCEIPCGRGKTCPDGQECVTIADGPGQVCR